MVCILDFAAEVLEQCADRDAEASQSVALAVEARAQRVVVESAVVEYDEYDAVAVSHVVQYETLGRGLRDVKSEDFAAGAGTTPLEPECRSRPWICKCKCRKWIVEDHEVDVTFVFYLQKVAVKLQ